MTTPRIITFGCRLNTLESEVMRREAEAGGVTDTIIVNTCAVTSEAVRQARQTIRRLRRDHPRDRIVVTGCAAQLDPAAFAAMPEVDRVLGNAEKLDRSQLTGAGDRVAVADIMSVRETAHHLVDGFEGRSRAFVQVQQGCDHRCTFCIIPFARGPNRSIAATQVIAQVRALSAAGYREIVLTGVDICSWGADLAPAARLGDLVQAVLAAVPDLPRLRLSTLDPAAIDDGLYRALAENSRLMPHLHLSLQAVSDLVLKRMKRRHDRATAFAVAERARRARPDVVLGADLIAGFPTESEQQFLETLAAVDDLGLTWLHVFPYSPRRGTPAARMPQIPAGERKARAARLRDAGDRARARFLVSRVGAETEILVEGEAVGRCPHYAPVRLGPGAPAGMVVPARITGAASDHLMGELVP
ncbi:MAG: tRNA (N(6)-L-threonylcarbamoyladenosine(37)-C(2))-methylthiotransferase MtaB [Rhodospirillales bacterium]|nr:MAG: tRNA (N(6)-L-threonylcarbamoyladenosine(37)-C(2))-methylthiotransferase MtaB [Rhodospirillales bacterium]